VDIASKVRLFRRGEDYYLLAEHYLPSARWRWRPTASTTAGAATAG